MSDLEMTRRALGDAAQAARKADAFDGAALAAEFADLVSRLDRPPLVAVVGEFDAGKSTLINRLLGEDVLPTDVLPTTARPARIQHGDRPGLVLNRRSGFRELRGLEDLGRYGHKNDVSADTLGLADVATLDVFLPCELLTRFQLLDTPGLSDPDQDVAHTLEAIREADAVVWCTMATQAWKSSEAEFWDRMPADVRKTAILVVTHCDVLNDDEERDRVRRRLENETKDAFGRMIMANLRRTKAGHDDGSVLEIRRALDEMVVARAGALRSSWAARAAEEAIQDVRQEAASIADAAQAQLAALVDGCQAVASEWAQARKAIETRFERTAQEFLDLNGEAGTRALGIVVREEFEEPQQVREEGIFVDDYKVVWKTRWMETLDWQRIDGVHRELFELVGSISESSSNELQEVLKHFFEQMEKELDPLLQPLGDDTGPAIALFRQHGLLLDSVFTASVQRTLGSIEGGGLYMATTLHGLEKEHRKAFPRGRELEKLIGMSFAFETAAGLCREDGTAQLEALASDVQELLDDCSARKKEAAKHLARLTGQLDRIADLLPGRAARA